MPDHVEDELRKLREKIAEQAKRAQRTDGDVDDVEATQVGASVAFSLPDDDSDDGAG